MEQHVRDSAFTKNILSDLYMHTEWTENVNLFGKPTEKQIRMKKKKNIELF